MTVRAVPNVAPDGLGDLIVRSAEGDETAFTRLYDAASPRLFGLVLRILRDRAQSQEVCQEVFLEIWRTAARFDPDRGSPLTWMMTIAHRKSVDRIRSAEASSRRDTRYVETSHEVEYDVTAEAASSSMDGQRVSAALAALAPGQRNALELAYFGGLTHSEVAEKLGVPLGTAKTRIRDGLIKLRAALGSGPDVEFV